MPSAQPTNRRTGRLALAALAAAVAALVLLLPAAATARSGHRGPSLRISFRAPRGHASAASLRRCRVRVVRHRFRVRKVTFTVNGHRVGVDHHAPFRCAWRPRRARPGRYTLGATARDVRGHVARAKIRVVISDSASQPPPAPAPYGGAVGISASLRGRVHSDIGPTIARLRAAGVTYAREDFIWDWVEQQPGQWNWSDYDTVVGESAKQGLRLIAIPDGAPAWASPGDAPPATGAALAGYTRFVMQAIARYGSNGTFWAQHPEIPKVPVTMWDVWNEPYFKVSWGGQMPDPAAYAQMFKTVAAAGRAVDSQAKFMLEAETGNGGTSWPQPPYLGAMFDAVPDLGKYADYVSVHPYTSEDSPDVCTPESPSKGLDQDWKATRFQFCRVLDVRKILDGRGAANTRIWITEIGYTTAPHGARAVSEAQQAQYVHDIFRMLRQWRIVDGICWYDYQTDESNPSDDQGYFGLVHADGSAKPAWDAFVQEAHAGL